MRWLLGVLWACACSGSDRAAPPPPSAALQGPAAVEPAPPASTVPDAKKAPSVDPSRRGLALRGVGAALPDSERVEGVGRGFQVGPEPLLVDLEDGTRVAAAPGAQLWALAWTKTLLLVSGELSATRVVDAQRAGSAPVRIASVAGVVELNPGAELALRVGLRGGAHRAQWNLARGSVTWTQADDTEPQLLIAGATMPKATSAVQWLSLAAGSKTRATRDKRFAALAFSAAPADADARLEAALSEQQVLRQQGHALLARVSPRHAALAEPSANGAPVLTDSPRAFQRELVAHAQRREAQATRLLTAAERSLLWTLVACAPNEARTCASLRAWTHRFAARLAS